VGAGGSTRATQRCEPVSPDVARFTVMAKKLAVDVWSDLVCPWCAIGKRRLEVALDRFGHPDAVSVRWHAFELDPGAQRQVSGDNAARLAQKYGKTRDEALAMIRHVEQTAAKDGLDLHLVTARSGNTFDGHRLLRLATDRGVQAAVKERFMRGYMTDGEAIGDHAALTRMAAEAGLDPVEAAQVLESDRYAKDVREDEAAARTMGVTGVPFFVLGGKYAVSGAQSPDVMLRALEQAWADHEEADETAEGAACDSEGCAQ
jgi:predicted DsbA family dithiol-disulfide isomerase